MYESSVNDAHNIINDDVRNTADNNDADGMTISTDNINVGCVSYVEKSGTSRKYCTLANEKSSCLHATTTTTRNGETASCTVQPFDIMTEPCGQRYAINADRTKQTVAETLEKPRHVGTNRVTLTPHNTIVASIKVQNADGGGLITDGDLVRSLFPRSAKKPAACSFGRLARITVPIPSIQRDTVEEELNNNDPAYDFMLNHDDDETSNLTTKIYEINEEVGRAFTKKDETSVEGDVLATTTNAGGKSTTWWQHFGGMAKIRCDRHFLSAGQTQQSIADLVEKPLRQAGSTPVILTPHCTSGRATEVLHEDESSRISNDGLTRLWSPRSAEKPAASSNSLKLVTVPSLSFKRDATKSAESSEGSAIATGQMEIVPIDLLAKDNVAGRCHQTSRGIDKENAEATPSIHGGTVHDKGEGEEKLVALLGRWPPFHDIYFGRYDDQTYAEELSNEEVAFLINLDHDTNEPALHDAMFGQLAAHQEEDTVDLSCLRAWTFSVVTFSICLPLLYQLFRFLTANFTDLVLCAPLSTSGQGYGGVIDIF